MWSRTGRQVWKSSFSPGTVTVWAKVSIAIVSTEIRHTVPVIVVYSDDRNTVVAPLGDPGRDVDKNKVVNLMVMSHAEDGPVTFNEMLPSTIGELEDLEGRISTMQQAIHNLRSNARISDCGERVVAKAKSMSVPDTMGIREFMAHQILNMEDSVRKGFANGGDGPGYKLIGNDGSDICQDEEKVRAAIDDAFGGDLSGRMFVQGQTGTHKFYRTFICSCFQIQKNFQRL